MQAHPRFNPVGIHREHFPPEREASDRDQAGHRSILAARRHRTRSVRRLGNDGSRREACNRRFILIEQTQESAEVARRRLGLSD